MSLNKRRKPQLAFKNWGFGLGKRERKFWLIFFMEEILYYPHTISISFSYFPFDVQEHHYCALPTIHTNSHVNNLVCDDIFDALASQL